MGDAAKMKPHDPVAGGRFRGKRVREARKERHLARVNREIETMRANGESIKIDHWLEEDKLNNWLWIRVSFTTPIIPVNVKTDIRTVLTELFHEHL
jgi:hypothetical protein